MNAADHDYKSALSLIRATPTTLEVIMKIISLEEHYSLPAIAALVKPDDPYVSMKEAVAKSGFVKNGPQGEWPPGIFDLGASRIADMDEAGIDVQILSHTYPAVETVEPSLAVDLAAQANDAVAGAIDNYPDRLRGFATLPMLDPEAAARELERAVRQLGFVGALINGHVNGRFLDDKFFWPVFECAEALGVPIYLHPTFPPQAVIDAYYGGFAPGVNWEFATAGGGWHIDAGIHCMRLILGGVFDQFPKLQIITGHQFQTLSWWAWRADHAFSLKQSGLKRTIKEYLRENFYGGILPGEFIGQTAGEMDSGWSNANNAYQAMVNVIGIDRIVFTTDYPYGNMNAARQFFDQMPISQPDKEKISHLNVERLFTNYNTKPEKLVTAGR
jgi:predicted TIM-barrel fold metal-dependent hydrolase